MIETDSVGIAGDWHGNVGHALKALKKLNSFGIKYVFQLGDFGVSGSLLKDAGDKLRTRTNELLERQDQWLFITLGNHENYDLVERFDVMPTGEFADFLYEPKAPRILYFQRGQSLTISGRNFLSLGGAASIDYKWRQEYNAKAGRGKVWWAQERITVLEIQRTIAKASCLGVVDVFLAHDVFASAPITGTHRQDTSKWDAEEFAFAQTSRDALEKVARAVLPKIWLHGHYHQRIETEVELSATRAVKSKRGKFSTPKATVKTFCFAKDDSPNSTGVLFLEDLSISYL
jgi:hypothetical protein